MKTDDSRPHAFADEATTKVLSGSERSFRLAEPRYVVPGHPRTPARFEAARLRTATPVDDIWEEMGIEFQFRDGRTMACRLSLRDAESLARCLTQCLDDHRKRVQDPSSSGMPSS